MDDRRTGWAAAALRTTTMLIGCGGQGQDSTGRGLPHRETPTATETVWTAACPYPADEAVRMIERRRAISDALRRERRASARDFARDHGR